MKNEVLDWLFPRWCDRCAAPAYGEDMPLGACWACALQWPDVRGPAGSVLFADRVYGMHGCLGFRLQDDLHALVHQIKYGGDRRLALRAGRWMASGQSAPASGVLVPVPLHWKRRWKRGFNQADWIARGLAQVWGMPVERGALRRVKHRVSLTGSNRTDRATKLRETYDGVPREDAPSAVLVDDVLTTGATLRACAAALEAAGWRVEGAAVLALA